MNTRSPEVPVASRRSLLSLLAGAFFVGSPPAAAAAVEAASAVKVVYHSDDVARATATVRMIQNHLKADPGARIVVVALNSGVEWLLKDRSDPRGNPYEPMVDDLATSGVTFRVCANTLEAMKIARDAIHPEAGIVPSGAAEIARLQHVEGYAYYKP
ncbi:MAG: hypothetical protein K0Q76_3788 [Panacagrimonas sp.]|jgi:intracellular sulfur oxidation DsrE/DsrF family protein|nr:DsrE family protein [Panacagrimonas sp.]MCC2658680.1 hypothetical protein [Panacagrimonas sp.]